MIPSFHFKTLGLLLYNDYYLYGMFQETEETHELLTCEKTGDIEAGPLDPSDSDENGATIPLLQLIQQLLRYSMTVIC